MADKQYPRAGCYHIGANVRELSLMQDTAYSGMDMREALATYEREENDSLNPTERREFFRGWRQNQVVHPANRLIRLAQYLNADQLDALGVEAQALVDKWDTILRGS
jgi:hypothetical protein